MNGMYDKNYRPRGRGPVHVASKGSFTFRRIAHRGASGETPENTLPAIALALQRYQVDLVELDLRLTRDHIPVILHDETLQRTTNGRGPVGRYALKDLKKFDAGYQFDPEGKKTFPFRDKGIKIPTLEELLREFPNSNFFFEIKERNPACVTKILNVLERIPGEGNVILGSFYGDVVRQVRRLRPPFIRSVLSKGEVLKAYLAFRLGAKNYLPPAHHASLPLHQYGIPFDNRHWISFLHQHEVRVFFWTIDDPKEMERLIDAGADGIMTNYPERLNQTASAHGADPKGLGE